MNNSNENLHVDIQGSGPYLVLVHGFLESNSMWNSLHLEKYFTTVKIELPGHGISSLPWKEQTISFAAKQIKGLLDFHNIKEFHIIGHSLGGYVVLEYISQFGISGKTILLHSNFWQDDVQKQKDRERVAKIVKTNKSLFLQEAIPALFLEPKKHFSSINSLLLTSMEMNSEDIGNCAIAMKNRGNHQATVESFCSNLLIIQGEKDKLVSLEKMKALCQEFNLQMEVIKNCGHMGQHEKPTQILKSVLNFLS